ncbi:MAG: hypothetical protein VX095_05965, partial [Pseudomonadota bacterium]|nr:hypothetical protein [Pseudomonadota bacterium]
TITQGGTAILDGPGLGLSIRLLHEPLTRSPIHRNNVITRKISGFKAQSIALIGKSWLVSNDEMAAFPTIRH